MAGGNGPWLQCHVVGSGVSELDKDGHNVSCKSGSLRLERVVVIYSPLEQALVTLHLYGMSLSSLFLCKGPESTNVSSARS